MELSGASGFWGARQGDLWASAAPCCLVAAWGRGRTEHAHPVCLGWAFSGDLGVTRESPPTTPTPDRA